MWSGHRPMGGSTSCYCLGQDQCGPTREAAEDDSPGLTSYRAHRGRTERERGPVVSRQAWTGLARSHDVHRKVTAERNECCLVYALISGSGE